jgi:hypothetical protein
MFVNEALKNHFEQSATISLRSLVLTEWNMNTPDNIYKLGNYRYRPTTPGSIYYTIPNTFDPLDIGSFYTGATDADIVIDGGFEDNNTPQQFTLLKEKMKMLYSLEDCLKPFRPRSGINKAINFFGNNFSNFTNSALTLPSTAEYDDLRQKANGAFVQRPRYYMSSRYDEFKYWTSYRTEDNVERGIAKNISNGLNFIDDAAPFVVYKNNVPANRVVVKMQTNVGDIDLGPFSSSTGQIDDPLYGDANKTTPSRWKIQYLNNNNWIDAISFSENDLRSDDSPIIGNDGYVEIQYGLVIPEIYKEIFVYAETLSSSTLLPEESVYGYAYLVKENSNDPGTFYIWMGSEYESFSPTYGWSLVDDEVNVRTNFVTDFTSPDSFIDPTNGNTVYREFSYLNGLRIVVETMNKFDTTFDLIEMSPRLIADISDKVIDYRITKSLSDLGNTSVPVTQLLASTGQISLFDDDQSFNSNNTNSIVAGYLSRNIKFNFYEVIVDVDGFDYYIPIKTLYVEGIPQSDTTGGTISCTLRDFYFYFESMPAPSLLMTDVSLSMAISLLLDYVGFTNYTFKRLTNIGLEEIVENDPIIPYFFVAPDQNLAQVLSQLAISTQSAMFFDEYNNFIVMSKNYLMPAEDERSTDLTLVGNNNQTDTGVIKNESTGQLPNILSISSQDKRIFNDGKIVYTTRYIQRSYGNIRQSSMVDRDKTWIYKPVLLWEVAGTESTKTINSVAQTQGNYVLGAMPLNSDLTSDLPIVRNGVVINNIIDVGENVYWLTRYQGYFYAGGEIIKYDAAEFNITGTGNVWISSNQEYQKYFSDLPFNGKIYPTGLLRIFSEPYYEVVDGITRLQAGPVAKHGRSQFGTPIASHTAGLDPYWSNNTYVRGCDMQTQYLFNTNVNLNFDVSNVSSSGTTLTLSDIAGIQSGQYVNILSGIGQLNGVTKVATINTVKNVTTGLYSITVDVAPTTNLSNATVNFTSLPRTEIGAAGVNNTLARQTTRNGIIKNFMATSYINETEVNSLKSTQAGTIQSSALVMNGPSFRTTDNPRNFVSYVYKNLNSAYTSFGTRVRIVGQVDSNENRGQTPIGSTSYYQVPGTTTEQNLSIGGGSGGLGVLINPSTNNGYYFEIIALTERNIESYLNLDKNGESDISINNIVFYKVKKDISGVDAIPIKLWGGLTSIIVDDGKFTGQYRMAGEENTTVYDLAVEYEDIGKVRRFYLYINNKLIQVVDDPDPLPIYNNVCLFVRGSSRCMFENIFALSQNYSQNTVFTTGETLSSIFGDKEIDANESFRKYAMSGLVQGTYLTGIGSQQPPKYNMYFDEFGTIMRECSYFNIRYDRSYPALYAQLSPTFNRIKGYSVSGFEAGSYGAEFLIFNATDAALNLDETTGNYLRIQGITFTQDTTYELTVDEYFKKRSSFSDPELQGSTLVLSPLVEKQKYDDVKISRLTYGKNEFTIDSPYIQTQDDAEALMGWIINKIMVPKMAIGLSIFSTPTIQLGDIVNIDYKDSNGLDLVASTDKRFVVYNIEYTRDLNGPSMNLYLSEV